MNQPQYFLGAVSQSLDIGLYDDFGIATSPDRTAGTFPPVAWKLSGSNAPVTWPTLVDLSGITAPYLRGGVLAYGLGSYRLDLPDEMFTAGFGVVTIRGEGPDAHLLCPVLQIMQERLVVGSSNPEKVLCFFTARNLDMTVKPGISFRFTLRSPLPISQTDGFDQDPDLTAVSDANGFVQILLAAGMKWRCTAPDGHFKDADVGLEATFHWPPFVGRF